MLRKIFIFLLVLSVGLFTACSPAHKTYPNDTLKFSEYIDGGGITGISGKIIDKATGKPLQGAYVNIYPDAISNLLGPSQFISTPTNDSGHYQLEVPPGTYYVVARKRISGQPSGPLSPGDYFSEHQRIVTTVVDGKLSIIDLPLAPMKAPMFFKKSTIETRTDTGIRGILLDSSGKPVPGSFAVAYDTADIKRLPDYASTLSDREGRFVIYLPKSGDYYLSARIHAWDMPRPGELYGKLGDPEPMPIKVLEGKFIEDVKIVLTPFTGTYKEGKSRRPY